LLSFTERIIGAARLDVEVYEEVEADTDATGQAMSVVLLASLAGGLGSVSFGAGGIGLFMVGGVVSLVGWATWAFLIYVIGTHVLPESGTRADVGELMRTLGFAQSPGLLRFIGSLAGVGPLVLVVIQIWLLVAMVVAIRQALDYTSTWRAIGVCLIAWFVTSVVAAVLLILVVG